MSHEQQKILVQSSFGLIASESNIIAIRFYNRLFEVAPQYEALFTIDMPTQRQKFFQMMGMIVAALRDMDRLTEIMQGLGKRHAMYGVSVVDYTIVREALLWAIADVLGKQFTPEMYNAWKAVYDDLSELATGVIPEA